MTNGLVSIIVPTFERTVLLRETLNSLLQQTYRPIEIWVVDDGSSGIGNKQLCDGYDEVNYIRIANSGGPAAPRNTGIRKARGEYIAFVDDDDLWLPEKLENQLREFSRDPRVGLVHTCCRVIDQNGELTGKVIGRPGDPSVKSGDVSARMMGSWTLMTSTVIVRAAVLERVGFFNEEMPSLGEDMEYWCRCSFFTHFAYLDIPLVHYREHKGISSRNWKERANVPAHLMKALVNLQDLGKVTDSVYRATRDRLIRMQLKRMRPGFLRNLSQLFSWNALWFFNFESLSLFFKQLFRTKP